MPNETVDPIDKEAADLLRVNSPFKLPALEYSSVAGPSQSGKSVVQSMKETDDD